MNSFDLRKYLTENKLTSNSSRIDLSNLKVGDRLSQFEDGTVIDITKKGKFTELTMQDGEEGWNEYVDINGNPVGDERREEMEDLFYPTAMSKSGMKEQSEDEEDPYGGVFINGITGYVDRNYDADIAKAITAFFTTAFPNQKEISSMDLEDVVKVFEHLYRIFDERV